MKKSLHLLLAALLVTTVSACNDDPLFEIPCDAPTADAGVDQTVTEDALGEGANVTLDGSASIPAEGDAISTWKWTLDDGTELTGPSLGNGIITVNLPVGVHTITLETTTVSGCTDTDTVTITVEEFGPVVILPDVTIVNPADGDEFLQAGTNIIFEGNAVDADGVEVPPEDLEWTSDVDGVLGTGNTLEVDPGTLTAGPHLITLTGIDAEGLEGTADITIVILAPLAVSFADDVLPYFTASCNGCHGAAALGDIRLDSWTEVTTGGNANGLLITIGNSDDAAAILIPQLKADHNDGPDDIAFVDDFLAPWINDGALDN